MTCAVCRQRGATLGALCTECCERLAGHDVITPQQIEPGAAGATPAALVDPWGRVHHLDPRTAIGRAASNGLVILDASVSRQHAEIVRGDTWRMRDVGSKAGTYVNDRPIGGGHALQNGDRLQFGHVPFYFVDDAPRVAPGRMVFDVPTHRAPPGALAAASSSSPTVTFELHAPSGGGGGFVVIAGKQVQLTTPQYELIALLVRRMIQDAGRDANRRGFVHASELLRLSWDASSPSEDHVRQLVRRVRQLLIKAEIGDLIEARRGVGYRLRVVPRG